MSDCPRCREPAAPEACVLCRRCLARHHRRCWVSAEHRCAGCGFGGKLHPESLDLAELIALLLITPPLTLGAALLAGLSAALITTQVFANPALPATLITLAATLLGATMGLWMTWRGARRTHPERISQWRAILREEDEAHG